ncbi:MAG: hypothetical protein Q8R72_16915 [Hylemonella sp.]|nr:hypothetical protein [Hylemonella sp.]
MIECGSLELTQARVQARHGQRVGEAVWQRLEMTREFGALLEVARASPLQPWLQGVSVTSGSNQIEASLRSHWRTTVAEVAAWMPTAWQSALNWCAVLPDLPVLQHLAQGGEALPWMQDDPDLRALCAAPAAQHGAALAAGRFAPLAGAWATPQALPRAWRTEWERRLPQPPAGADDSLQQLAATVLAHAAAFAAAPPGPGGLLRRSLQTRLTQLLRRAALEPAVAFIHVALCALDLERLRGELLGRALFAPGRVG